MLTFKKIKSLHLHHTQNCDEYSKLSKTYFEDDPQNFETLPYLPARAFKEFDLKSIDDSEIYKVMKSSGTSGKQSNIFLDRENAISQEKTLSQINKKVLGCDRREMLILGNRRLLKESNAKKAAVTAYMRYSKNLVFSDDVDILSWIKLNSQKKILVFGFTFELYEVFKLLKCEKINVSDIIVLHGGGWKKLIDKSVSNSEFVDLFKNLLSNVKVINYYGMIEQLGSVFYREDYSESFIESQYTRVIIRDEINMNILENGNIGLIQLISSLPKSYPGHSILTDDLGLKNNDNSFQVIGRQSKAEIRGCSDAK